MTKDECLNIIKENDKHMAMINFLDPFLTNLELIVSEEYPDTLFFKQNNEILFEFDYNSENKYFWVDYSKIWVVFETKFGLNYNEIQAFIKYQVEKGIKIGDITPRTNKLRIPSQLINDLSLDVK